MYHYKCSAFVVLYPAMRKLLLALLLCGVLCSCIAYFYFQNTRSRNVYIPPVIAPIMSKEAVHLAMSAHIQWKCVGYSAHLDRQQNIQRLARKMKVAIPFVFGPPRDDPIVVALYETGLFESRGLAAHFYTYFNLLKQFARNAQSEQHVHDWVIVLEDDAVLFPGHDIAPDVAHDTRQRIEKFLRTLPPSVGMVHLGSHPGYTTTFSEVELHSRVQHAAHEYLPSGFTVIPATAQDSHAMAFRPWVAAAIVQFGLSDVGLQNMKCVQDHGKYPPPKSVIIDVWMPTLAARRLRNNTLLIHTDIPFMVHGNGLLQQDDEYANDYSVWQDDATPP